MSLIETPQLTPFNGSRVSFGRHESFPLRYSWLTKGFNAVYEDGQALSAEEATVRLGVGRNMVNAIRYWLRATRMVEVDKNRLAPTAIGKKIFGPDGYDRYLEDEATVWLLHWLLASNPEYATAWYWFFNRFHKPEFTSQEAISALAQFCQTHVTAKQAISKINQDGAIVLRMYVQSKAAPRTPIEEALDSPLATLRLISYSSSTRRFQSRLQLRPDVPVGIFGLAIADVFEYLDAPTIRLDELMQSRANLPALGSVFRLNEPGLLAKLEELVEQFPGEFEFRESAGLQQLYKVGTITALEILDRHYELGMKVAA